MTSTDPTITIAGLTAERDSLIMSLRAAIDDGATCEETRLIATAELACVAAERDALAAQLAAVRAELDGERAAGLAHDSAESASADQFAILRAELVQSRSAIVRAMVEAVDAERDARLAAMGGRNTSSATLNCSTAIWGCQWAAAAEAVIALIGASPPAARPAFAGVSASDLDIAYIGGQRECHQRHDGAIKDCCRYAAVAAVLARLEVSLVAPVDPEAVARAYHDDEDGPPDVPTWIATSSHGRATAAMRATLTAAGIPVTPEVGK